MISFTTHGKDHVMQKIRIFAPIALIGLLAACGETTSDRALSGGALGAGAGAVGGALTGGSPLKGAVIGGAAGAAGGALTDEDDVNLGKPVWRK
jgi:osmotically inducible lipoprotein OsmB